MKQTSLPASGNPRTSKKSIFPTEAPSLQAPQGLCKPAAAPHLEARALGRVHLVVQHGLQNLLVAAGHQAHGAQDLQHGHLGLAVLRAQALRDGADGLGLRQHVSPPLRVVHQSLDAADEGGVDAALAGGVVHAPEEVQQAGQAIQLDEAGHEPAQARVDWNGRPALAYYSVQLFAKRRLMTRAPLCPTYSHHLTQLHSVSRTRTS